MDIGQKIGRYFSSWNSCEMQGDIPHNRKVALCTDGGNIESESVSETAGAMDQREVHEGVEEMNSERLQILKMVEERKITAEEAAKLLAALESPTRSNEVTTSTRARWLRVRVTDIPTGRSKVNVNVPIGVISAAGKLGIRFGLKKHMDHEGIDIDELIEAIRSGAAGKLVDVTNEEGSEHVEIFVE